MSYSQGPDGPLWWAPMPFLTLLVVWVLPPRLSLPILLAAMAAILLYGLVKRHAKEKR